MRIKIKNRSKMSHLSPKEIKALKSAYYNGVNTKSLVKKYNIDVSSNNLYSTFPFVKSLKEVCIYCKSNMYFVPPPKNAQKREEYFCTECLHAESISGCGCRHCKNRKNETLKHDEVKRILNNKNLKNELPEIKYSNSPSLDTLSLKEKAYLGALLRTTLDKKYLLIDMSNGIPNELAPMKEYKELIIAELLSKRIIVTYNLGKHVDVHIENELYGKITYDICIDDVNNDKEEVIISLMHPKKVSKLLENEAIILLKEIQVNESMEYIILTLQQFNLSVFDVERRYKVLFLQILRNYSQGQLYNFIYTAIRNYAAYASRPNQGYVTLSNYIYRSISDRYERAFLENWNIKNFRRSWKECPSVLSKIVCYRLLNIGESSFYQVVSQDSIAMCLNDNKSKEEYF